MKEIWKQIKNYEGSYEISSMGRIKTLPRKGISKTVKILSVQKGTWGYIKCGLYKNGIFKNVDIHRLVAQAFIPNPENLPMVNHKDGDKTNNNVNNLEWCTSSYNKLHSYKIGTSPLGEKHGRAKLTESIVKEIRKVYVKGSREWGSIALAKKYNVTHHLILLIAKREIWKTI